MNHFILKGFIPGEESVVERLGEGVQRHRGLRDAVRLPHDLPRRRDHPRQERLRKLVG